MRWAMVKAVVRADLYRLLKSKDYWIPLLILGGMFFVVLPAILLGSLSLVRQGGVVTQIGEIVGTLPDAVQNNIRGDSPNVRASYAFAVYLLAPIAIVVPLTISSAVGATNWTPAGWNARGRYWSGSRWTVCTPSRPNHGREIRWLAW
jgi:hypothetical protein